MDFVQGVVVIECRVPSDVIIDLDVVFETLTWSITEGCSWALEVTSSASAIVISRSLRMFFSECLGRKEILDHSM